MGTQISNFQFSKQIKLNFQHFSLINVLGIMLNKFIFSVLILFNALIFLIGVQNEMIFSCFQANYSGWGNPENFTNRIRIIPRLELLNLKSKC